MKSIVSVGKNVSRAIESGLKELNVTQDEVSIKILDEGGLFRKAKVELTLDKEVEENLEKTLKDTQEIKEQNKEPKNKQENKKENCENKKEEIKNKKEKTSKKQEEKKPEKTDNTADVEKLGKDFLEELFTKMSISATVECFTSDMGLTFNASGEKVSNLIGKRGETLNAIQEILSNVVKNLGFRDKKVFFDVENYKNRREMSLINLAERMAGKAIKINKPIKLEKMSAYERKIIHTALQNMEGVTSKSEGEEPNRRLVIIPVKKD